MSLYIDKNQDELRINKKLGLKAALKGTEKPVVNGYKSVPNMQQAVEVEVEPDYEYTPHVPLKFIHGQKDIEV